MSVRGTTGFSSIMYVYIKGIWHIDVVAPMVISFRNFFEPVGFSDQSKASYCGY